MVVTDANVNRREEQLDQLCNLVLLKLESDKRAKSSVLLHRPLATPTKTAEEFEHILLGFVDLTPKFSQKRQDRNFTSPTTINLVVEELMENTASST